MPTFKDLKNQLKTQEVEQSKKVEKEVSGYSLKECIEKGSYLLQIKDIQYEVLEKGSKGFMGFGRKKYRVLVYGDKIKGDEKKIEESQAPEESKANIIEEKLKDIDGTISFISRKTGIFIKISPPKGLGRGVKLEKAINLLEKKQYKGSQLDKIKEAVKRAEDEWIKIGEYRPDIEYDSRIKEVNISQDELSATLTINPPLFCGRVLEVAEVMSQLKSYGISYGINEEKINDIIENGKYGYPVVIAEGIKPENGKNAQIKLYFDNKQEISLVEDEAGKVDFFADFGLIHNVVSGQLLAVKEPRTKGTPGKTVTGRDIEPSDGADVEILVGKNARVLENGLEVIASGAGRAVYEDNVFEVEPIHKVNGNVGVKTGSIVFLGDVHVSGNIEDGFSVKAAGNIYVSGNIGKCEIEADADIIVQRGIVGKEGGLVKAGKDVISKFIENANIRASGNVVITDGILNSHVDGKNVYCLGKRGTITGGHIRATEEIQAKVMGSQSYTETRVEAGIAPEAKERLRVLEANKDEIEHKLTELSNDINTLRKQKQATRDKFPIDKQVALSKMIENKTHYIQRSDEVNKDLDELKVYLQSVSSQGIISVFDTIYPRVEVTIKNTTTKINSNNAHVSFTLDKEGSIKTSQYQQPKDKSIQTSFFKDLNQSKKRKKNSVTFSRKRRRHTKDQVL